MRELVEDNEAGVYVRAADPADLAEKVGRLDADRELTERLGRNGRALAEREFDRDLLAGRVLALLERVARESH